METRAWWRGWTPSATPAGPGLHPRGSRLPPQVTLPTVPSGHERSRTLPAPCLLTLSLPWRPRPPPAAAPLSPASCRFPKLRRPQNRSGATLTPPFLFRHLRRESGVRPQRLPPTAFHFLQNAFPLSIVLCCMSPRLS